MHQSGGSLSRSTNQSLVFHDITILLTNFLGEEEAEKEEKKMKEKEERKKEK